MAKAPFWRTALFNVWRSKVACLCQMSVNSDLGGRGMG